MNENRSARKLTTYQFFEMLQLEWVIADLRSRIYPKPKDKEYWNRVKSFKEIKIEEIAERNSLPTIFTDAGMKSDIERRVYNDYTHPNFHHQNESKELEQGYWDLLYYYNVGSEVRIDSIETMIAVVVSYTPFATDIKVKTKENEVIDVPVTKVRRIL